MIDFAHWRLDHLGYFAHDRAFRDAVDRLLDDAHRLAHFGHANQVPVVGVAVGADRNFEIELRIVGVGLGLAHVPLHTAGAQYRPGYAESDAIGARDYADILGSLQPDAVGGKQRFVFVDLGREEGQEIRYVFFEAGVSLVLAAADAKGMRGQARAAVPFENLQDFLPVAEGVEQRRHGSDVERVRAQPKLVAGNTIQFSQDHANVLRARWRFHVHQFLDRFAVAQPIRHGGTIVHPVDVGIEHRVGAVLGDFFHAAVQVSDDALCAENFFAVELQDDAQHAVRRRMLRSHVDDEFVRIEVRLLGSFEVEVGKRVGRDVVRAVVLAIAHCPLSIPRLICTHSWSCCRMP